jgi:hypothetical protein
LAYSTVSKTLEIARLAQVGVALQAEQFGRRAVMKAHASGGAMRHLLDEVHVFRLARDLEIADQGAKRRAAEGAEFFFVDLLEHGALVEFQCRLEVLDQLLLGGVEHLDLLVLAPVVLRTR